MKFILSAALSIVMHLPVPGPWMPSLLPFQAAAFAASEKPAQSSPATTPQQAPLSSEEAAEAPTVEIPADRRQMIGVRTATVAVQPMAKTFRAVGRVEYDERKLATVNLKFEGWIEKLHVDYAGRPVKQGEPLAEIYSPELVSTQLELINLLRWSKKAAQPEAASPYGTMLAGDAQVAIAAVRQRLRFWDISDEQIAKIEETGTPVRTLTFYSPVNGVVVQKMAVRGMRVMPGEKLFDLADLSTVWVVAEISEHEIPLVRVGDTARITLSYFPGRTHAARVEYIYPALSGETRTARVRFTLPNPDGELKPQMFTDVELQAALGKRLAVPDDAIIDTGTRRIVYVDRGEGLFEPRVVKTGLKAGGFTEILKGLKPGEKVASSAAFLIDSEAQFKNVVPLGSGE